MRHVVCLVLSFSLLAETASFAEAPQTRSVDKPTSKADKKNATRKPRKKKPAPYAWVNPIPKQRQHPSLKHGTFQSPSLKHDVGYAILLPPGYTDGEPDKRFPVVYYLHGGRPGSESKSIALVPQMHSAMESGQVPGMIYVFVNGGPVSHYNIPGEPTKQGADLFIKELIPHIDTTYRTIADREHRGIEGFSQGGRGTMRLSLRYPDLFCSAAAGGGGYETERKISESGGRESATLVFAEGDNAWDLARAYSKAKTPEVDWMIYVGTKGFNYQNNLEYMAFLKSLEIPFESIVVPDVPHSGLKIYEQRCVDLMRFHAANFGLIDTAIKDE
ncbi:alpha/beta hydrolase [Rhodopirellula europaea]|uniref:alpha/beta hydrolase n=1 Tax=Rhodopirellula europaea TaxID=1263866 RepID=UPI003D2A8D31|tara:strand:- start:15523 stop:16512 length:990 start_codon:yes stop_codon:yes gene_type:complete